MTTLLIAARAIHIGACLLFFATFAFDCLVAGIIRGHAGIAGRWQTPVRWFALALLPVIFLSGIAWFALVSVSISGQPLQFGILKIVWTQTEFGTVSKIRLAFWLASAAAVLLFSKPQPQLCLNKAQLLLSGSLLGSLAWAGHGQEDSRWHLSADILHLLAAGIWPVGLFPFALLLKKLRCSEPIDWAAIATLVRRFSGLSLATVAVLAATGLVNTWYLVGSLANLLHQPYGRWLSAKILLFCVAVSIGAVNLLRLKPRLLDGTARPQTANATAAQLQFNVTVELFLATAIVVIVAVLGILPP